ncbi:MAG: sigma-54 dependent transcriptional regulator [Bacteroidota bacterium]|nr:sigma-54 dependent transcriptional regulator [Bacteroidota bacterium]
MNEFAKIKPQKLQRVEFQQLHGIIGESIAISEIVEIIQQVATTDITVLITGESGVGKEVFAKAIHKSSQRANKPIITVNCGAIPEGIIESELFGHEKGSFTGANEARKGYFEIADGGTIFLDEIGELPLNTQSKFLRVLDSGEFMRVGSNVTKKVDVRVIAATNRNLETEVFNNNFRKDLFFRLRSINIHIPPLRERTEDIPFFAKYFAVSFVQRNNIIFEGFSDDALEALKNFKWYGNVRELKNAIESLIVIRQGKYIEAADIHKYLKGVEVIDSRVATQERNLPVHTHKTSEQVERELIYRALLEIKNNVTDIKYFIDNYAESKDSVMASYIESESNTTEDELTLDEMEKRYIIKILQKYHGNRRLAAKKLNISERTLYRKINQFGLNDKHE